MYKALFTGSLCPSCYGVIPVKQIGKGDNSIKWCECGLEEDINTLLRAVGSAGWAKPQPLSRYHKPEALEGASEEIRSPLE